jgi:anthraniloyl-CoA monooxygenase
VALLGDAVHTAHFSVGSGTKMAMEDAIELARQVGGTDDLAVALHAYQEARKPAVARIQDAAVPSLAWWERFGTYQSRLDPFAFAFHFFSRSISIDKIEQRDPELAATARRRWQAEHGSPALRTPLRVGGLTTRGRVLELATDALTGTAELREDGSAVAVMSDGPGSDTVLVTAPGRDADLPTAVRGLPASGVVVITGGTALTRTLLSEEARLGRGLTTVLVDDLPDAAVETVVLAQRADAVARPAGTDR